MTQAGWCWSPPAPRCRTARGCSDGYISYTAPRRYALRHVCPPGSCTDHACLHYRPDDDANGVPNDGPNDGWAGRRFLRQYRVNCVNSINFESKRARFMNTLTHLDEQGQARMVDVGGKTPTVRSATATGRITMSPTCLAAIRDGSGPKGDVLAVARVAGIMAAKKTGELIPLCHPLALDAVVVDFTFEEDAVRVTTKASLTGKTGVEMEAMTAASVALLTVYDMAKAIDKGMVIEQVRLLEKTGGKSGTWTAA